MRRISTSMWIVAGALALAGVGVALLFVVDAHWLRSMLERRIEATTGREVVIEALDLRWQRAPRLQLRGVAIGGLAPGEPPLLTARAVDAQIATGALLRGRIALRELQIAGAVLNLRGIPDDNPGARDKAAARRTPALPKLPFEVASLQLDDVTLNFDDRARKFVLRARADSLPADPGTPWQTRIEVEGRHDSTRFSGQAVTGSVLTLQDTGRPFPVKGRFVAGTTAIEAEGTFADLLGDVAVDLRLHIAGPSLSALYPTLPVALPTTPPYRLQGHLRGDGRAFAFDRISGRIGSSDIRGSAAFTPASPRPMLKMALVSDRLALADLGVLVGVDPRKSTGERVLPDSRFDVPRMRAIDAEVSLKARQVVVNPAIPLEDFAASVWLDDGVLRLEPMKFGFSGGAIVGAIKLDSRQRPMQAEAAIDLRKVDFARLFPTLDRSRLSAGELGAQIRLRGQGQSVADLLGTSRGTLAAAMSGGRISHAVIAAASLDGGRLLPLLISGDEPTPIRCAAISMDVDGGIARSRTLVFDTESVRIDGDGAVNLATEQFEAELRPRPKRPSVLSLRAPIYVSGNFRSARIVVSPGALVRGGAAAALAVVNPLAALLPLIETGTGEHSNCAALLTSVAPALEQAEEPLRAPVKRRVQR